MSSLVYKNISRAFNALAAGLTLTGCLFAYTNTGALSADDILNNKNSVIKQQDNTNTYLKSGLLLAAAALSLGISTISTQRRKIKKLQTKLQKKSGELAEAQFWGNTAINDNDQNAISEPPPPLELRH